MKTNKPNVVVLLLETFTLNAWDAMPNLQSIAKEGIFFSNIYATGNRSDRGILGVIGGFPAHPQVSMLKYPNKTYLHSPVSPWISRRMVIQPVSIMPGI